MCVFLCVKHYPFFSLLNCCPYLFTISYESAHFKVITVRLRTKSCLRRELLVTGFEPTVPSAHSRAPWQQSSTHFIFSLGNAAEGERAECPRMTLQVLAAARRSNGDSS